MDADQLTIPTSDGSSLAMTRWPGHGPSIVLLHAGVADSRVWAGVAHELRDDGLDLVAYDRRGYGDSPTASVESTFSHVDDLVTVLDALGIAEALLVGNSRGGGLALDTALLHPHRVTGVIAIGSAVTGMTDDDTPFDWEPDEASAPLITVSDDPARGLDERIAALAHLWLDGPTAPAGRVAGPARELFDAMNRRIFEIGASEGAGGGDVDAWTRLGELTIPVLCAWGDLDLPCDLPFLVETARRVGQGPGRVLPGVAHLPGLERPELVAALIREVLQR
jgi:pimeloyl-ACP methyl ester carboxylesterase